MGRSALPGQGEKERAFEGCSRISLNLNSLNTLKLLEEANENKMLKVASRP